MVSPDDALWVTFICKLHCMKTIQVTISLLLAFSCTVFAQKYESPLAAYSDKWNDPKYKACNTAEYTKYLSADEKKVIYVLNLARMSPKLFCATVLPHAHTISSFIDTSNETYYKTLVTEMNTMQPLGILKPDSACYVSAHCHAATTGKTGYVGHDRQSADCRKKQHYQGECCDYGSPDPITTVLALLVDSDVPSLGHRRNCLGSYTKIGVSTGPHKTYSTMAVLDFAY